MNAYDKTNESPQLSQLRACFVITQHQLQSAKKHINDKYLPEQDIFYLILRR